MKESIIQTLFSKVDIPIGVYELKLSKGNSIPYNVVKEHQIEALLQAKHEKGFFHKIGDNPIFAGMNTRFHAKKPFDCFYIKEYPAYIGICFYKPRQKKEVLCIDIDDFLKLKNTDNRKSLTEEKARETSAFIVVLSPVDKCT